MSNENGELTHSILSGRDAETNDGNYHTIMMSVTPNSDNSENFDVFVYDGDTLILNAENKSFPTGGDMYVVLGSSSHEDTISVRKIIIIQDE